jgi:hypothetical protein
MLATAATNFTITYRSGCEAALNLIACCSISCCYDTCAVLTLSLLLPLLPLTAITMCTLTAVVLKHYDPKAFDFGKKKAFPMRPQHFYASCAKAMKDLDWSPQFSSDVGLKDSYENDFVHKKVNEVHFRQYQEAVCS